MAAVRGNVASTIGAAPLSPTHEIISFSFKLLLKKEEHIKNPNTTIKYATDNATYFFKYKDLMVLSNYLKKDDAIKMGAEAMFIEKYVKKIKAKKFM